MKRALIAALGLLASVACTSEHPAPEPEADAGLVDAGVPIDADAPADAADPSCPSFSDGEVVGMIPMTDLAEVSGIAASHRNPGVLWVHNDAGAGPRIHAIARTGAVVAVYDLGDAVATDWEDIAVGPGPAGASAIYVGDIGDNSEARASIDVYRVAEPDVKTGSPTTPTTLSGVERFTLVYPDHAHNSETLLVDPRSGDVYVVVKKADGVSPVFRAAAPLAAGAMITLEQVSVLRFGVAQLPGNAATTGGSISPAGDEILIRTYDSAFLFRRAQGMSVAEALAAPPCPIPLEREAQGEAIGFALDGSGYYSASEGSSQPIYFYTRR